MQFYEEMSYFNKRTLWSAFALFFALIFLFCTLRGLYIFSATIVTYQSSIIDSTQNNNSLNTYLQRLKTGVIENINYAEITPDHYYISYNVDVDKEVALKEKELGEPLTDSAIEVMQKFSSDSFYGVKSRTLIPEDIPHTIINHDTYYKNKLRPLGIAAALFFLLASLCIFLRERVIYKDIERLEAI